VSIGGHTDDVGSDSANLKLSQARAQAVALAIKTSRPDLALTVKGFGETKPVASNGKAAERAKNRRVEIRFAG
jgi:OOP family OmpA-OmpF porin